LRWTVGDVTITRVVELVGVWPVHDLLPELGEADLAAISWLRPAFIDDANRLLLSVHMLVVRSQGRTIAVDTCVGNHKQRGYPPWHLRDGPFLHDLAAAGAPRESIDTVVCTHLHADHIGWNTMLVADEWQPTFPNARYLVTRLEWDHHVKSTSASFADSVQPIADRQLFDFVAGDHEITSEVWLEPTPGHSPGHVSVRISSRGADAVITGDLIHHPCQLARPDALCDFDEDNAAANATRARFLAQYADRDVLVIGTHFPGPTAGRIVREGGAYRLV
jgi:glyoxylase-like metal-dependent hydrolase (beta-lactamase superfamily II)